MSKLVSYLQSLIPALLNKVPESASPKRAYSNQQITGATQQVVSPIDGWAALNVINAISNTAYITARTSNGFSHQHSISSMEHSASLHIPVRKGDTVTVAQGGFGSGVWLNFFERIGGGWINRLIAQLDRYFQGGAICLKASLNLYLKHFVLKYSHVLKTESGKISLLDKFQEHTPLLITDWLRLQGIAYSVKFLTHQVVNRFVLPVARVTLNLREFSSKKEIQYPGILLNNKDGILTCTSITASSVCSNSLGMEVCHE